MIPSIIPSIIPHPLTVHCAFCAANPGEPCRTVREVPANQHHPTLAATGPATTPHYARDLAAAEIARTRVAPKAPARGTGDTP